MKNTITFTRKELDEFKAICDKAKDNNSTTFIWKGTLNNVSDATSLINKLEYSSNLTITL